MLPWGVAVETGRSEFEPESKPLNELSVSPSDLHEKRCQWLEILDF